MALAAEAIQFEQPILIETEPQPLALVDADNIPELQFVRRRAGQLAAGILEDNRQLLRDGKFEQVPIPVDALGTARRVVEARKTYGEDSPQYQELFQGLRLDCERLLAEAFRKNTWEYFAATPQRFDSATGEYYAHGFSLSEIVTAGLSPVAEPEEQDRRTNEFVEEHTYKALGHLGLKETVSVHTISECPDWAIEAYKKDNKASHGGYVPGIKKLINRGMRFTASGDRLEEQLAVSGTYITHEVVTAFLAGAGISSIDKLTKTDVQGKQLIDTQNGSVIDLAQTLDRKASEVWGKRIFLGEEVADDDPLDYSSIPAEAEARRLKLAPKPLELADYLISLEDNDTDRWAAEALIDSYLKEVMLEVAKKHPEQAEIIFDKATADGLQQVAWLRAMGEEEQAGRLQVEVERNAPAVSYCGAGSCGLEAVNALSSDAKKARELGLEGNLLHDKIRRCPGCGEKKVHYGTNGKKACTSCDKSTAKHKKPKIEKLEQAA